MPFFNFNLLTDPPGDPLVDEDFAINQNMDKLDARLQQFATHPATIVSPPLGTEAMFGSDTVVGVWQGSAWRVCDSIPGGWGAWTVLPLLAPVVERPLFTPKYRINTVARKVELAGGLRADAAAGPWARSKVQITATTGGIPSANKPVYDSIEHQACGAGTVTAQYAGARVWIEANGTNSVKVSVSYQGDDIGGNFVMLDGCRWFY